MATVREATFDLLRRLKMTTVFGNPGSTELPFLRDFSEDFRYVLGLQEATVLGMAEGFAQGEGRAALVNLHTGPGLGNAMGAMITAWHNKTPLLVTAGQQDRRHRAMEPLLTGKLVDLARPYVKRSFEPVRAADVAFIEINNRGYSILKGFRDAIGAGGTVPGLDVEGIDFVGVARGLGVEGELVERDGDLLPAFKRALNAGRPYLLDVVVDPEVPELLK